MGAGGAGADDSGGPSNWDCGSRFDSRGGGSTPKFQTTQKYALSNFCYKTSLAD